MARVIGFGLLVVLVAPFMLLIGFMEYMYHPINSGLDNLDDNR